MPLLENVHEFSFYVNCLGNNIKNKPITKPNFQINDVHDILEALGIQLNTDIADLTCQYYYNEKDNKISPLLICLFKAVITICNGSRCVKS